MIKYLIQKQWFRDLFKSATFYKSNGFWNHFSEFKRGEKVEDICGAYNTLSWCSCGNELVHSDSFIETRYVESTKMDVYDYACSYCEEKQHRNPCIMQGIHRCDKDGRLI